MRGFAASLAVATGLLSGLSAQAADRRWCSGVSESASEAQLRLARVVAKAPRVHFISSPGDTEKTKACPSVSPECTQKAFLVPGDQVLVDEIEGDFACASFVSGRAVETGGWLPREALEFSPPAEPRLQEWAGIWRRVEARIVLSVKGDVIAAKGEATWGALDPARVRRGGVNIGEFDGAAPPKGARLVYGDGYAGEASPDPKAAECHVRLRHFGRYLVVEDNHNCGGVNVSFSGVYVRAAR